MAEEKILVKALKSFASGGGGLSMRRNQTLPVTQATVDEYGPDGCGFVKVCTSAENAEAEIAELTKQFAAEKQALIAAHDGALALKDKEHAEALAEQEAGYKKQLADLRKELKESQKDANAAIAKAEKAVQKAEAAVTAAGQGDLLGEGADGKADANTGTGEGGEGDGNADATTGTGEGGEGDGSADAKTETKPADTKTKPADKKPPAKSEAGLG